MQSQGAWRIRGGLYLLLFFIIHSAFCLRAWGQYTINWSTIDGGGGTSTGGVYAVTGTIGQPDAGTMSGGSYSMAGGFWGIVSAVQTPGAPLLRIVTTTTNAVVIVWPAASSGFKLQFNADLNTTTWTEVGQTPAVIGGENQVIGSPVVGNRFYRLRY
jgi:hypothetical protein